MCGRSYQTVTEEELEARYHTERLKRHPLTPNYNLSPTQSSPVIYAPRGKRELTWMRWGLVPAWAKDLASASKYSLINARSEEILEKKSYRAAFEKRRCLWPVSGFYEWHRPAEGPKIPYAIFLKNDKVMSIAGIWERWKDPRDGTELDSFAILTCASNAFMEKIHNRMPVILPESDWDTWLDPHNHDTRQLLQLARPLPSEALSAYAVSTLVNSPKNNIPELLEPLAAPGENSR